GNRAGEIRLQDFNMERSRKVYDAWTDQILQHDAAIAVQPGEFLILSADAPV
ncbi:hypothetical protein ACQKF6_21150, partial [Bacillus velezensis]